MAQVFQWQPLSKNVAIFRLRSLHKEKFPEYRAGQNITLYRSDSTLIFSIASAPSESKQAGYLEFFVSREVDLQEGEQVGFANYASGDFTLDRTKNFENVLFVATGTGIAPFISMIRELSYRRQDEVSYTLIHASRNLEELGYYKELTAIAEKKLIDLLYIPTVSRPSVADWNNSALGKGRAGNVLRLLLHLSANGEAVLPASLLKKDWRERFDPASTIILACGSHGSVADIKSVANEKKIKFEKEDW